MSNTKEESKKNKGQEYAENIANELIKHLEAGTAPWQLPWEPVKGLDIPYNHTTGNRYSGMNNLVLMMQRRFDPRWMTYKQAQSVDAQVRKGEKGISLNRVITHTEKVKRDENGTPVLDEQGNTVKIYLLLDQPYIKSFSVFNGEQIDGLPPYERKPAQYDWEPIEKAEKILTASKADIDVHPMHQAAYSVTSDIITMPTKEQFPNQESYYSTMLHELGHWTGHPSRMDRDFLNDSHGIAEYAKEELRAEIASMMLSRELGLPHDTEQHAAYVQHWVQALKDDPMEIIHAAKDAQQITEYVRSFDRTQDREMQQQLDAARQEYQHHTEKLSPEDQQHRQVLEHLMNTATLGLSESDQRQSQLNFYQSQLQELRQSAPLARTEDIEPER